jgi:hypothetical protein
MLLIVWVVKQAKEEMMEAMGLNTEEEGSTMAFLRRGYKVIRAQFTLSTALSQTSIPGEACLYR